MKKRKMKPIILGVVYGLAGSLMLGTGIAATSITSYYDAVIRDYLGVIGRSKAAPSNDGLDKEYNKLKFNSIEELDEYERDLVRNIGGEGYVLLKNEGTLPLNSETTTVSLFSHSSVDLLAGGTGSGTGSLDADLKSAFEQANFKVNEKLWNFYASGAGSSYKRATGSVNYGHGLETWAINECPISVLQQESGLLDSAKNTTPIFVMSRTGGEGRDLARGMHVHTSIEEDKNKHYLEPDSVELGVLSYLNNNFEDVVLVVNANNAMELGWVKDYPHIKSVIWAPGGGGQTALSLVDVLSGKKDVSTAFTDAIAAAKTFMH